MPTLPFTPDARPAAFRHAARCATALAFAALLAGANAMAQEAPYTPGATAASQATTPGHHGPAGRWISANGNVEVEIAPCGNAWCGTITRVLGQQSMSRPGEVMTPVDTRPALGMTILKDFRPDADDAGGSRASRWRGQIYNRENGKTYDCLMSLDASEGLVLRAYVGLPLFGRTQVWHRADTPERKAYPSPAQITAKETQP